MIVFLTVVQVLLLLYVVWYAVRLWLDPSTLYRSNWFDRATFGWLEGRPELARAARVTSVAGLVLAAAMIGLMIETW
jgi:hypothetical protein